MMHLGVNHEETPITHATDIGLSNAGCKSGISSTKLSSLKHNGSPIITYKKIIFS